MSGASAARPITDYFGGYGYQNADAGVRAGTDLMLNMVSQFAHITDKSATMTKALRQASKNILIYGCKQWCLYRSGI